MNLFSRLFPPARISLEKQVEELAKCGIRLKPEFTVDTLLNEFSRDRYEERSYIGAIIRMAGYSNEVPLSNNLWYLDTECVEDTGSYAMIAERFRDLAQGELPIENIRDHVDHANGDAWVAFELHGETIEWHARVKDDWIDPEMLSNFCALLKQESSTRRYTFLDLKGQDCIIGCATEDELLRLRKLTGMKFSWLE